MTSPSTDITALFDLAMRRHQSGELAQAETIYRNILDLDPRQLDCLNLLGLIAHQTGRNDVAVELIGQALARNDRVPDFHNNMGEALRALGRADEAIDHYRKAMALDPGFAEACNNLGNALRGKGLLDEAAASYRQALTLQPQAFDACWNLANLLMDQGRVHEATVAFERALALRPDHAEAHNNLAVAYRAQGNIDGAISHFERAFALKPRYQDAVNNLGWTLLGRGDVEQALAVLLRSLAIEETVDTKALLAHCMKSLRKPPDDANFRDLITRAFSEPWARPGELVPISIKLIKRSSAIAAGAAAREAGMTAFDPMGRDPLLLRLLESAPVGDIELERILTKARFAMLQAALSGGSPAPSPDALIFACALARQCFINEYVFAMAPEERTAVERLRASTGAACTDAGAIPTLSLAALAAYLPLHSIPGANVLLDRDWPRCVADLLDQQIREPQEELALAAALPRATDVVDGVSHQVQRQYEENPYPRWVKAAPGRAPTTVARYLRNQFPSVPFHDATRDDPVEILVAGCGTGQQSLEVAQRYKKSHVLAVDLSRASLAHARRKTLEAGVANIDYAQADILKLDSLGRTFDIIEACGVLHHLAQPLEGWRILLSLLRPHGFMCVGLYSDIARTGIVGARNYIERHGYGSTADEIRGARQAIIAAAPQDGIMRDALASPDFYSLSACRDLLFHVQEHRLTLPEISGFLDAHGLALLGFELDAPILEAYRRRFPDDRSMTDLEHWHRFERDNPATFGGMYVFWVQRRA